MRYLTYFANDGCAAAIEQFGLTEIQARQWMEPQAFAVGLPLEMAGASWVICYPESGHPMYVAVPGNPSPNSKSFSGNV